MCGEGDVGGVKMWRCGRWEKRRKMCGEGDVGGVWEGGRYVEGGRLCLDRGGGECVRREVWRGGRCGRCVEGREVVFG